MNWISVKDGLPASENALCLIAKDGLILCEPLPWKFDNADPATGRGVWLDFMAGIGYMPVTDVSDWLEIPEPPQ